MNGKILLLVPAIAAALLLSACGQAKCQGPTCAGGEGDGGETGFEEPIIKVSGNIKVYPPAVGYLTDAGLPVPLLMGLTLRVEEPLEVALNPNGTNGVFYTTTLPDETAAFLAPAVDTAKVKLGIATGVRDDQDAGSPRVVRAASVVYDELLKGAAKEDVANAVGYALPTLFHDKLSAIVTTANGGPLPNGSLIKAGFILGQVLDANGAPIAGVTVVPDRGALATNFYYPQVGFDTATKTSTSANGTFVFVHSGNSTPETFNVKFQQGGTDLANFFARNAGAATDAALIMQVTPGK